MSDKPTIIYTKTDEAPALATFSLLPIIQAFTSQYNGSTNDSEDSKTSLLQDESFLNSQNIYKKTNASKMHCQNWVHSPKTHQQTSSSSQIFPHRFLKCWIPLQN